MLCWHKPRQRRTGYVAEYCDICRQVLPFEILEHRMAAHCWFIRVENGRFLSHTQICCGCNTESECDTREFAGISRTASGSIETLITQTHPNLCEKRKDRLAEAEALAAGVRQIDERLRFRLIRESFGLAEPHFRSGLTHHGWHILKLALRPLRPTVDEIRACLQRYRESGSRMGALVRVQELMVAIYPEIEVKDSYRYSY
jgi:hypothetical protein